MEQNAVIILRPSITIRAERVAEVLHVSIEKANKLLSQPDTGQIIRTALEAKFQTTVDELLQGMLRVPMEAVPAPRVDCSVTLPELPRMFPNFG